MDIQRKTDITMAKGLCMILVVVGHTLAGGVPVGHEWFKQAVDHLYLFHMPFFMFLSGFLYFRPQRVEELREKYWSFTGSQAVRLLLPFFTLGLVVVIGKFAFQNILHVDGAPSSFKSALLNLFWETNDSPATFIWYIYVLFFYVALSPIIHKVFKDNFAYWIGLALIVYFLPNLDYMYLDRVAKFFIFFVLGGAVRHHEAIYSEAINQRYFLWLSIPAFLAFLYFVPLRPELRSKPGILVAGLMAIPILLAIARKIMNSNLFSIDKLVLLIGTYSYVIYLFNVIVIGVVKGVMFKFTTWNGVHFWYFIPTLIVAGIMLPILAEVLVLRHIPFIRDHILGSPPIKSKS